MNRLFLWGIAVVLLSSCSTSGTLTVPSVNYQAIRTDFAQPTSIPDDAKIVVQYFFNDKGVMQPVVTNRTDEILIIDQTKSFVIMPSGTSVSYFDPTVRSNTTGSFESNTSGASFNLGAVAGALGIGGILGTLLGGTTIGSSNTVGNMSQQTVTIADQPLVNVGPRGSIAMSKAFAINCVGKNETAGDSYIDIAPQKAVKKFSVCVTYSVDEGKTFDKLVTNFYVSSFINEPVSNRKVSQTFYKIYQQKPDALAEDLYMFIINNNIAAESIGIDGEFITHSNVCDSYIKGALIDYK